MKRNPSIHILTLLLAFLTSALSLSAQTSLSGALTAAQKNWAGGSYVLNGNSTITGTAIQVTGNVTLDLNGYVLENTGWGRAIEINGTLTIVDSRPGNPNSGYYGLKNVVRTPETGKHTDLVVERGEYVTINGGIITSYGGDRGGVIFMHPGSTLYFNGGTIAGGVSVRSGAYDTKLNENGVTEDITESGAHARTDGCGGGLYINDGCTAVMNGGDIAYCCTAYNTWVSGSSESWLIQGKGGGVFVDCEGSSPGRLELKGDSRIYGCKAVRGGGVYIHTATDSYQHGVGGYMLISGGTIETCSASVIGGGVAVPACSVLEMTGGTIRNNVTTGISDYYGGAGVFINRHNEVAKGIGTFIMSGGNIIGNQASGRGCGVHSNGIFTMSGGVISGNAPYDWDGNPDIYARPDKVRGNVHGGGVYTRYETSVFTMTGGTISGNVAASGGGVMVWDDSEFIMTGGTISGNSSLGQNGLGNGGAVYVQSATFVFDGGQMSGNKAVRYGGAVNINSSATLELNAGTVSGNTANYGGGVSQEQGKCSMTINPDITISGNTAKYDGGGVFVEMGKLILDGCKIKDNEAETGNGGGISLKAHRVQGSIDVSISNDAEISGNKAGNNGGGIDIYLSPQGTWTDQQTVVVDFASGDVTGNEAATGGALHIYANESWGTASMTVGSDSAVPEFSNNRAIGNSGYGGAIAMDNGTMEIVSGTFTGNKATGTGGYGGAVVLNGGNMNITDAEFSQNSANDKAGCVYVAGSLDVTGKIVIKENIAGNEAGAVLVDGGNLDIKDCEISGNKAGYDAGGNPVVGSAACGGALSIRGGSVNIEKGDIVNNMCTMYGGGLYVYNDTGTQKSVSLLGNGVFKGNRAVAGGGIYVAGDVLMSMEGDVDDNLASRYGGGLYLEHVTKLDFEGNISFNRAQNGGGLFLNASDMVITGGLIRNNRAVPDPSNPDNLTGSEKPSTGYLVNPLLSSGAMDFVGVGGGLYLNTGSTLVFDIEDDLGVYENDATWGADDIFANGDNTSVTIPNVENMNLTGYRVPTTRLHWAEDYIAGDTHYAEGTNLKPDNGESNMRYDDAIMDMRTVYIVDFADGEKYKTIDKYLSLEIGYELIIVDMIKKGLKVGESATFVLTPAKESDGDGYKVADGEPPYLNVIFVCTAPGQDVRRRVALPSGWWEFKETGWSWAYTNADTQLNDVSREKFLEAGNKLEYVFVNERLDEGASPEDVPETYEVYKINRMRSTKTSFTE